MKAFDKFLKLLKTDRNTFFTYLLTLGSIFVLIDRLVEFLLIVFTGVASQYWGPIAYAVAFLCPIFAFHFSMSSKFIRSDKDKRHFFYYHCIALYILGVTMIVEWANKLIWIGLISLPGYTDLVSNFAYLIRPALSSLALALPLLTWRKLFNKLYKGVNDTKLFRDSIADYSGINLKDPKLGWGTYTNEIFIGVDKDFGHDVKLPESKRFESTLVVGISGSGKTSLIFEPWVAQDINKKYFYRETSKTLAFAALRTGIATLNAPYNNAYINDNFHLNMLVPVESKKELFKQYFKKMILSDTGSQTIYKDCGITYMAPDYETISRVKKLCDNFGISYNIIDPENPATCGLNPFSFDDPVQIATSIATVLKAFQSGKHPEENELAYRENHSTQVVQNLAILLKVTYPKINSGKLPTLEDMLKLLTNFELIEKMVKIMEQDEELAKKYQNCLNYFRANFFKDSPGLPNMQRFSYVSMNQLDTLLRYPGVKKLLCNRTTNLNYDEVLANGDVTLVCTRRGDLGEGTHKAFGLFFLLLMQYSVLRRPGNENSRIPHFLYIDEFPDFICPPIEPIFTLYRKYRVAPVVSAQNLAQLHSHSKKIGETIIANCSNKIVFGNNTPEDNEWWSKEIGAKKRFDVKKGQFNFKEDAYEDKGTVQFGYQREYSPDKIQMLKFKKCLYKIKNLSGGWDNGIASIDFVPSQYNEKQKIKVYDFTKFTNGISEDISNDYGHIKKSSLAGSHFSDDSETENPIKMDESHLTFDANNDDAITYTFRKDKKAQ